MINPQLFDKYKPTKTRKPNPWMEHCEKMCDMVGMDYKTETKAIYFKTLNKLTFDELKKCAIQAKSWQKNPPALFWKLIREKVEEVGL